MAMVRVTEDEYMLQNQMIVDQADDCFNKMDLYLNELKVEEGKEEAKEAAEAGALRSRIAVLHSRYASRKNTMRDKQAHPVFDEQERVAVFHNGFVSNYKELAKELYPHKDASKVTLSDSELIALTLGKFLDQGMDIRAAITSLIETKLIGTWRMAIVLVSEPNKIYVTKNAGPFYIGRSQESVVLCSDACVLTDAISERYQFKKLKSNILYEISDDCSVEETALQKRIEVNRKPKRGYSHIFEEEVLESIDAMSAVTDDGAKFISDH